MRGESLTHRAKRESPNLYPTLLKALGDRQEGNTEWGPKQGE